jgi:ABC-type transport system involved in cytochrome bd biosynthesis fused ATPase/permease subunit
VITHSLELMDIADQVIMLKGGRIAELAPRLAAGNSQ